VTPLHRAAGHNQNKEVIDFLIGKGSDINAKNKLGATPLHWAATNENREILETLIKRGCNIHITDSMGNTLLHYAAIKLYNTTNVPMTSFNIFHNLDWDLKSNPANITFLLDKGLDINAKNEEDETPLHCAAMFGNPAILEILIENDGNIHDTDSNRDTLLHYAARCNGNEKVIIFLLDKGLDIKAKNKNGKTPLHWAAKDNPYEKVISTLLDADETKETIHTKDENGKTPLMLAAAYNSSPYVCIILIEAGSRLAEKDNTGKTALEYLRERKDWTDIEPSIW
jgi:serine/threonine-protein phosphatase 6 regulatory ankyrin repeat subunit B